MLKTLIVADALSDIPETGLKTIEFATYLSDYPKLDEPRMQIINLCATDKYLSQGYYCSLLAEARKHKVLPSVNIINDINVTEAQPAGLEITVPKNLWVSQLADTADAKQSRVISVYFGQTDNAIHKRIARWAFEQFPAPILQITLDRDDNGLTAHITNRALRDLTDASKTAFWAALNQFIQTTWRASRPKKRARWDMAILHNPDEKTPPSDEKALKNFVKAAEQVGIHAELITPKQASSIASYDALFIRETTAINHHTYRLARKAEQDGLIVMDDATSILRCCNKVFLHDAFSYNKVPSPKSDFVSEASDKTCARLAESFGFPMVLKLPESSFSIGVYKVENIAELKAKLLSMLEQSALVLIQEFLRTEYDWRVGVLNGKPIYACRYFMARNHWQIYNHSSKTHFSGNFETLPTFEVPKPVLDAAVKASLVAGKGLYGVDLKHANGQVYVIEVNDNPSLESKVEDKYLGKELYMLIMQEFANRLEARGR
ncbi:RimK family protein [Alteromonas oceanisediminis]|uniref:RimK family protein n=1 Tax=Alteromonas oceanisediminis TaxID=2836180 RepID=UPI001BDA520E|nr:RimK family protein [Alteromonas oceanisediminis]MBT0585866.1 RimK family alpha-L-glutamate ligase [Alteromonas oceanisediminis]